jgi:hypothetical protein
MGMSGYSQTPLAAKLGIKRGMTVAILDAPDDSAVRAPRGHGTHRRSGRHLLDIRDRGAEETPLRQT